ncbi:hypothetical protein CRYUN_Cryun24cG0090300 [Craigia yunnanensis]
MLSFSKFHIDVQVGSVSPWRFTGFYGHPETQKRKDSWNLLRELKKQNSLPWLCAGDYNELLHVDEKIGGNERPVWQIDQFRDVMDDCLLYGLPVNGPKLTWFRGNDENASLERLDRGLASAEWLDLFPFFG